MTVADLSPEQEAILALLDRVEVLEREVRSLREEIARDRSTAEREVTRLRRKMGVAAGASSPFTVCGPSEGAGQRPGHGKPQVPFRL